MSLSKPSKAPEAVITPESHAEAVVASDRIPTAKRASLTERYLAKSKIKLEDVYKKVMETETSPSLASDADKVSAMVKIQVKLGFKAEDTPEGADGVFGRRTMEKYYEFVGKDEADKLRMVREKELSKKRKAKERVDRKQDDKKADALLAQINPESVVAIAQGRLDNAKKRLAKAEEAVANADLDGKKAIDAAGFALVEAEKAQKVAIDNMKKATESPLGRNTASPFYQKPYDALTKANADVEAAKAAIPKAKAAAEANKKAAAAELEAARMEVAEADQNLKTETIKVASAKKASDSKES